jgi:hypothetical protein
VNTNWRDLNPDHRAEYEDVDEPSSDSDRPNVAILWPGNTIARFTGVIVEGWEHKNYGRGKRAYLAEFTEAERKKLPKLYTRAYGWVLRTGHPKHVKMSPATFDLLTRAANFFASI